MLDQLRNAWITFQATKNTIPQLELSVQQEKQTVILYDQEYKIGSRSLIDLLNVQNNLFLAQVELTNEKFQQIDQAYVILKECGILTHV